MACGSCNSQKIDWTARKVLHGVKGVARKALRMRRSPPEVALSRLQICIECDARIPESNRCQDCGCPVNDKAADIDEKCPRGKWPDPMPTESTGVNHV